MRGKRVLVVCGGGDLRAGRGGGGVYVRAERKDAWEKIRQLSDWGTLRIGYLPGLSCCGPE